MRHVCVPLRNFRILWLFALAHVHISFLAATALNRRFLNHYLTCQATDWIHSHTMEHYKWRQYSGPSTNTNWGKSIWNINIVYKFNQTKNPIKLVNPSLDTLAMAIFDLNLNREFLNARKIFLQDVPLTDQTIENRLQKGATYRVHLTKSFEDCAEMCDIYLFKVIE